MDVPLYQKLYFKKKRFFLVYHICPLFSTKYRPHLEQLFGTVFAVSIDRWN
jgi:hypothetical protein